MSSTIRAMNLSLQIWGSIITIIIFSCMCSLHRVKSRRDKYYCLMLFFNMGNLVMDALALMFRGRQDGFSTVMVRATNFSTFACSGLLSFVFLCYIKEYIQNKRDEAVCVMPLYLDVGFLVFHMAALIVNLFYPFAYHIGKDNLYERQGGYSTLYLMGFFSLMMGLWMVYWYRKCLLRREIIAFLIYIFMPLMTGIAATRFYGLAIAQFGSTTALIIVYLYLQVEYGSEVEERKNTYMQSQVAVMMSQIRPHFLYNALNSIRYLCEEDGIAAAEAIDHFSLYLRGNMDSIERKEPIPLFDEINHVKNYLYIEHLRYPEIEIKYELDCTDFKVPALTLQPIVENAFKHGYTMQHPAGTIVIRTYTDDSHYYLQVQDDGVGFDTDKKRVDDNRSHVGVENTRKRIEWMCGGAYEIKSEIGKGTIVTVSIPK